MNPGVDSWVKINPHESPWPMNPSSPVYPLVNSSLYESILIGFCYAFDQSDFKLYFCETENILHCETMLHSGAVLLDYSNSEGLPLQNLF